MRYFPKKIEQKWQKKWLSAKTYEPDLVRARKPFYNLMMFPYPSAEGLHVGNMYAFVGADIFGRLKRMQGYDVFEPIGLDGFGIHSENYAMKVGRHPVEQSKISEKNFYRQLSVIGNGFAWNEHLETYDPEYYQWTQWIFVQMFKNGLAYRKKQEVNWCPSCKTVLADEQVISGECERCGTKVIKKELEQWFFRITKYAEKLLNNLEKLDWSEKVKIAQKNWIGKSEGAAINFDLINVHGQEDKKHKIEVFTTRPDTLFGATFLVISPERAKLWLDIGWQADGNIHAYVKEAMARRGERDEEKKEKTGIFSGVSAINPVNQEKIPVWISDYVLAGYGTGAIMAVPAHDERDFEFAKKFNLPIRKVIEPEILGEKSLPALHMGGDGAQIKFSTEAECWTDGGTLTNSGEFSGLDSKVAKDKITLFAGGKKKTQYRLRDWLISRQRYWGPPIPMFFCDECKVVGRGERKDMPGWYAVLEKDLPVRLPYIKEFRPTGKDESPLAANEKFHKVRCPMCKSWARRETDVSDTFLDSAWYYLRYTSLREKKKAWNAVTTKKWFPVDMYIGGAEHSVLHLLYVRFLALVFKEWKLVHFEEPFKKFRAHGLLIKDGAKMSKSKGNVVNPDEYIRAFGADALRMYLMFLGPFIDGGDFRDTGIKGVTRFLERVWKLASHQPLGRNRTDKDTKKLLHKTIKKVTEDIELLQYNTAISALMVLLNKFEENPANISREDFGLFLKLISPFAPHVTEELWQTLYGSKKFASIHHESWPKFSASLIKENTFELIVQINGKMRDKFEVPMSITQKEAEVLTIAREKVKVILMNQSPRKIIFVPMRLINIVL